MDKFPKNGPIDISIADLLVGVSLNQKLAIVNLVLGIASCDTQANTVELDLLQIYLEVLGLSTLRQALAELDASGISGMIDELTRLSNKQKEFLVLLVNHMICVDGPANAHEFALATYFFDAIGLPIEKYINLIEEANRTE